VSELTGDPAVLAVELTALPAADPAFWTALPTVGLAFESPEPTDPVVFLTAEPALRPALETTFEAVLPAFCTAGGVDTVGRPGTLTGGVEDALELGGELEFGLGELEPGVRPEGGTPPCRRLPEPVEPVGCGVWPVAGAVAAPVDAAVAAAVDAAVAALSSREAREGAGAPTLARVADTDTGAGWPPTCGHPWNATIALASRNVAAAPASSEPDVPNPARYPCAARTCDPDRTI
jgi:hypothetical protein